MADFSKYKAPNGTTYDVKDAAAGKTLALDDQDLLLKNAAGTEISRVTLPGGGEITKFIDLVDDHSINDSTKNGLAKLGDYDKLYVDLGSKTRLFLPKHQVNCVDMKSGDFKGNTNIYDELTINVPVSYSVNADGQGNYFVQYTGNMYYYVLSQNWIQEALGTPISLYDNNSHTQYSIVSTTVGSNSSLRTGSFLINTGSGSIGPSTGSGSITFKVNFASSYGIDSNCNIFYNGSGVIPNKYNNAQVPLDVAFATGDNLYDFYFINASNDNPLNVQIFSPEINSSGMINTSNNVITDWDQSISYDTSNDGLKYAKLTIDGTNTQWTTYGRIFSITTDGNQSWFYTKYKFWTE